VRSGDRVELVSTDDPCTSLRPGARGTVTLVDSLGTVHVTWDDGSTLGLVPGRDRFKVKRWIATDIADEEGHLVAGGVRTYWEETCGRE
jgi:hypothetical protein